MEIVEVTNQRIKASEGKILRRIADKVIFGPEVSLGYTYFLDGRRLDKPFLEKPEHYEEIDIPEDFNI